MSASAARSLRSWRNAVFLIFALNGLDFASWAARIPTAQANLHLDTAQLGLLLLAMAFGAIAGLTVSAPLLNRLGPRRGMVAALGTASLGLVMIGIGTTLLGSVPLVTIGLILVGAGNGCVDVMMNVEATAVEREVAKTILPFAHACFSLGSALGAGIGAAIIALGIPIFWHLLLVAVVVVAGVVGAVRFIPAHIPEPIHEPESLKKPALGERLRAWLSVWTDGRLILIGVVMLGMAFTEGSANDWLAVATVNGHHESAAVGALTFAVFVAAMTLARLLGGPLVDRVGRVAVVRLTAVVGAAGLLVFILSPWFGLAVAGAILWGLGAALGFPLGISAAADGYDKKTAAARVSSVTTIGYLAFLAGPPAIGFLGQRFGILHALFLVLALLILAGLSSFSLRAPRS